MTEPQPAVPSPRAALARRALLGALLLGILADPLLRNEPWGVGLAIWMTVFAATVIVLGRQAGRFGLHRDLRLDELGKHIQLRVSGDENAIAHQHARQHHDDAAIAQRKLDDSFQHGPE